MPPLFRAPTWTALALTAAVMIGAPACNIDQSFSDKPFNDAEPDIEVTPAQLVWTGVPFGGSEIQTFTVANNGDAGLTVTALRAERSGAFTVLGEVPISVPAGGSVNIDVAYSPTTDSDLGLAIVESTDPDRPVSQVELIGSSGSPRLVIEPVTHDFGTLNVLCRDTVWHRLSNVGTADLVISNLYETGEGYRLAEGLDLPATVPVGGSVEVAVEFAPLVPAEFGGTLWVESNDPAGIRSATQQGSGTDEGLCVEVTPGDDVPLDLSFVAEYRVADIAFLLDTTGSMSGLANAMASEFAGIAASVSGVIPDVTFGSATYEDYYYADFGSSGDKPFVLDQQQTSNLSLVQSALSAIDINSGADGPEGSMEALYQGATGAGYDQNCNGVYDGSTDVPPFQANVGDAYGGTAADVYDPAVEGTGSLGGFGFRPDVLPIFIIATDAPLRDPEAGYRSPGGCSQDAAGSDVVRAVNDLGGKVIGVAVGGGGIDQLRTLAASTDSYGDMDGDGREEEAAVVWGGSSADFQEVIVDAIDGLVSGGMFDRIWLEVEGTDWGLVASISPDEYLNVPSGEATDFEVQFNGAVASEGTDETYPIRFALMGQVGTKVLTLDRFTVYVLVPGS